MGALGSAINQMISVLFPACQDTSREGAEAGLVRFEGALVSRPSSCEGRRAHAGALGWWDGSSACRASFAVDSYSTCGGCLLRMDYTVSGRVAHMCGVCGLQETDKDSGKTPPH